VNGYLLDTNVVSEARKGKRADSNVVAWFNTVTDNELFLSVLVLGKIRKGIEQARATDPPKAQSLERWLTGLERAFEDRLLPITATIADRWGQLSAARPLPTVDGLLAATGLVHDLTFVTRNSNDVADTGVRLLNPFILRAE